MSVGAYAGVGMQRRPTIDEHEQALAFHPAPSAPGRLGRPPQLPPEIDRADVVLTGQLGGSTRAVLRRRSVLAPIPSP